MTHDRRLGLVGLGWIWLVLGVGCSQEVLLLEGLTRSEAQEIAARLQRADLHPRPRASLTREHAIAIPRAELSAATHTLMVRPSPSPQSFIPTPGQFRREREHHLNERLTALATTISGIDSASVRVHLPEPVRFRPATSLPPRITAALTLAPTADRESLEPELRTLLASVPRLANAEFALRWVEAAANTTRQEPPLREVGPFLVHPHHASWLRTSLLVGLAALLWTSTSLLILIFPRLSRRRT